jgi:hypothetical protein
MKKAGIILFFFIAFPRFGIAAENESEELELTEADAGADAGEEAEPENKAASNERVEQKPVELIDKKKEEKKKEKEKSGKEPLVEIRGRIHALWEMAHFEDYPLEGQEDYDNSFTLRRTQLKLVWRPTYWLMGVMELGTEQRMELGASLLRDVYIHLSPLRFIELRVGQFKKPFSRLEMRSPGKATIIEKGDGNRIIIDELMYGERDLGIQLSGRLIRSINLDYAVGVFNGSGPVITDEGNSKDLVGRLEIRPVKALSFGVNGSLKFFDDDRGTDKGWAAGADARVRIKGFRLHLEGLAAEDHLFESRGYQMDEPRLIIDLVGIVSYRHFFPISWRLAVEPVFKFEKLDPDIEIADDHVFIYGPGFNTYFGQYFRLMIHGELRRAGRNTNFDDYLADRETLMVQLCFDI